MKRFKVGDTVIFDPESPKNSNSLIGAHFKNRPALLKPWKVTRVENAPLIQLISLDIPDSIEPDPDFKCRLIADRFKLYRPRIVILP